jgi:serine/threonine protein kinase
MANNPYSNYTLAGEGASSCTYVPPVIHLGNTIVQLKKETTAQQNIGRVTSLRLPVINKNRHRLIYPSTNIKEVPANFPKGKCKLKDDPKNPLRTVKIPYGGKDLSDLEVTQGDIFVFFTGFENIFHGLLVLHKNNIAHLDVKSANMVGEKKGDEYVLKVIDFGLSKKTDIKSDNSEFYNYEYKGKKVIYAEPINYLFWSYDLRLLNKDTFTESYLKTIEREDEVKREEIIETDIHVFNYDYSQYKYPKFLIKGIDYDLVEKLLVKIDDTNTSEVLLKSDVFSLGLSLYNIWRRLTGYGLDDNGKLTYTEAKGLTMISPDQAEEFINDNFKGVLPVNWAIHISKNSGKVYFHNINSGLLFWDANKIKTADAEIEASKKVFELVIKMCSSDPFERLTLEDALTEYTSIVLPSIETAYPRVGGIEAVTPPGSPPPTPPGSPPPTPNKGGSRKSRTRRTNKKYVKAKKTRRNK